MRPARVRIDGCALNTLAATARGIQLARWGLGKMLAILVSRTRCTRAAATNRSREFGAIGVGQTFDTHVIGFVAGARVSRALAAVAAFDAFLEYFVAMGAAAAGTTH